MDPEPTEPCVNHTFGFSWESTVTCGALPQLEAEKSMRSRFGTQPAIFAPRPAGFWDLGAQVSAVGLGRGFGFGTFVRSSFGARLVIFSDSGKLGFVHGILGDIDSFPLFNGC